MGHVNICHQLSIILSSCIASRFSYSLLMRYTLYSVRHSCIPLGSTQFVIRSFPTSNTSVTLLEMSSLIYLGGHEYLWKRRHQWTSWSTHKKEDRHLGKKVLWYTSGVGGKHACVDLTSVSLLMRLGIRVLTVGHATLKVASCKVAKHKKTYSNNQHVFIPFAMLCHLVYGCCILHGWFCHP